MVLFGLMSGRSTATRLLAFSWFSLKICVITCALFGVPLEGTTAVCPPCSLASASGTSLYKPWVSMTANPCKRSTAKNWFQATDAGTGFSVVSDSVPLTRGSTTSVRRVKPARVRATASMSALTKFSVMVFSTSALGLFGLGTGLFLSAASVGQAENSMAVSRQ